MGKEDSGAGLGLFLQLLGMMRLGRLNSDKAEKHE